MSIHIDIYIYVYLYKLIYTYKVKLCRLFKLIENKFFFDK